MNQLIKACHIIYYIWILALTVNMVNICDEASEADQKRGPWEHLREFRSAGPDIDLGAL